MIPRTLSALLSLVGLMRIAEHEAAHSDLKRRLGDAEDACEGLKFQSRAWEAKFKKAVTDIEGQSVRIAELNAEVGSANRHAYANEIDATLWRKARDKRTQDRDAKKRIARPLVGASPPAHDRKDSKKGVSRG